MRLIPLMACGFVLVFAFRTNIWAEESASSAAKEKQAKQNAAAQREDRKGKKRDPWAVPKTDNSRLLMRFIERLEQLEPGPKDDPEKFLNQVSSAIRKACEQIRSIEKNESSEAHRFAIQRLLMLEIEMLGNSPANIRKEIVERIESLLKTAAVDVAVASLVQVFCEQLEELGENSLAIESYSRHGGRFAKSDDEAVAKIGKRLEGAGRRLGLIGKPMALAGKTWDGRKFDIASYKGKVVLVDFWTTWCGFCLAEFPNMKRSYQLYHEKGFEIVGINCDEDGDALKSFFRSNHLPWVTLRDDANAADGSLADYFGVSGYPTTFLLDQQGNVVTTDVRGRELREHLRKLLGEPVPSASPATRFPVFNGTIIAEKLEAAGERLIAEKKAKDLAELRKAMNRKAVPLNLPAVSQKPVNDSDLYRSASESVFILGGLYKMPDQDDWEIALGTAFALTTDGVLTTSCHVFDDDLDIRVMVAMNVRGEIFPVEEILAANPLTDTCLFRIAAKNLKPVALSENPPPGSRVRVLSHPGDSYFFFSAGQLANYQSDDDQVMWMNVTADFGQGSSGAPVFDDFGNVVGQVSRTATLFAEGADDPVTGRKATRQAKKEIRLPVRTAAKEKSSPLDERLPSFYSDPQMVFKMCVPVETIRQLIARP